jgi:subtilisin family serine protease
MRPNYPLVLLWIWSSSAAAVAPSEPAALHREGEVLVAYRHAPPAAALQAWRAARGLAHRRTLAGGDVELLAVPAFTTTAQALAVLRRDPEVRYAEPNYLRFSRAAPDDPLFGQQWGLHNTGQANFIVGGPAGVVGGDMNMLEAWDPAGDGSFTRVGDPAVVVAIVDDAIDTTHDDLQPNLYVNAGDPPGNGDEDGNGFVDDTSGWDFALDDNGPQPDNSSLQSHGTMVSGCAVARGNNGIGVAGTAWLARLLPLKVSRLESQGGATDAVFDSAAIIAAFDYARTAGAHIVNASFGGPTSSQAELESIQRLDDAGVLLVAAAGNDDSNTDLAQLSYPANYDVPNVLAVAATNRQDQVASFSQYGAVTVDVAAPGLQIVTTRPSDNYATPPGTSGTSFSSPYAAGVAALIRAVHPAATALELKARLIEGAEPADQVSLRTAAGRIDAAASLDLAERPALVVRAVALDGNGVLDPGETTTLQVTVQNLWTAATNVTGTLTAGTGVSITSGAGAFGSIVPEASSTASFTLSAGGEVNQHRYVPFTLELAADGGYTAQRRFLLEIGRLQGTGVVSAAFAPRDVDMYDEFHAWHVGFNGFPAGHNQLVIETTAGADIDLLVKRGTPPLYSITVGINPETDSGFFCTSGTAADCRDPEVLLSAGSDGNEQVVITGAAAGTYHLVIVNFAQLDAGLGYTLHAFTRTAPGTGGVPIGGSGGGGATGAVLLLVLALGALARRGGR